MRLWLQNVIMNMDSDTDRPPAVSSTSVRSVKSCWPEAWPDHQTAGRPPSQPSLHRSLWGKTAGLSWTPERRPCFNKYRTSLRKTQGSEVVQYLSTKEVMVEHVVVTELILAVELGISETEIDKVMHFLPFPVSTRICKIKSGLIWSGHVQNWQKHAHQEPEAWLAGKSSQKHVHTLTALFPSYGHSPEKKKQIPGKGGWWAVNILNI